MQIAENRLDIQYNLTIQSSPHPVDTVRTRVYRTEIKDKRFGFKRHNLGCRHCR